MLFPLKLSGKTFVSQQKLHHFPQGNSYVLGLPKENLSLKKFTKLVREKYP